MCRAITGSFGRSKRWPSKRWHAGLDQATDIIVTRGRKQMKAYWLALILIPAAYAQTSSRCADLTKFTIPGSAMVITKAEVIPASAPGKPDSVPAHCQADGMINERKGADGRIYGIGFAI